MNESSANVLPNPLLMEALAEFAAGAGHEINNPLATITGRVQLLLNRESDSGKRAQLEIIGAQTIRIRDMITDIMLFARPPQPKLSTIDPLEILGICLEQQQDYATQKGISLLLDSQAGPSIKVDVDQFQVVMAELLRNAIEASSINQEVTLSAKYMNLPAHLNVNFTQHASSQQKSVSGHWEICVTDHGMGFNAEQATHAFNPYYSGRQAGRGHGFGLCKCWAILRMHLGEIEIHTQGQTTVITRWFV